jgi:hypothetical protein
LLTVELQCRITPDGGSGIATTRAVGLRNATFSEVKSDFSPAARPAPAGALSKLAGE